MFGLSFWEIGLVMIVALVVLGPKRLPPLARSLGRALRTLQRASSDLRNSVAAPLDEVRQPLRQMRDDLYQTVSHFEQEVREEVQTVEHAPQDEPPAGSQKGISDLEQPTAALEPPASPADAGSPAKGEDQ